MIPVQAKPEYRQFNAKVRAPGKRFLAKKPNPLARDFRKHNYWRHARSELQAAYLRCAYTSRRIVGYGGSIDHFLPKVKYPQQAYEWDNYRLTLPRVNQNKGDHIGLVDPFKVKTGWFVLLCPSCLIVPGHGLDSPTNAMVTRTINILKLNSNELAQERCEWLVDLANQDISFGHLKKHYPFLAEEIVRQGIKGRLRRLFALN